MKQSIEKTMDCICPYGKDLPITTEKCPKCGLDLKPLARFYQISDGFLEMGDAVRKDKPGLAISYYHAAGHSSFHHDSDAFKSAIEICLDSENYQMASDMLRYAREQYPEATIWNILQEKTDKQKRIAEGENRRHGITKAALYISCGLLIVLAFFLFMPGHKSGHKTEKTISDYAVAINSQLKNIPELNTIKITSDSTVNFSGNMSWENFQQLWSIMVNSGLPLAKCNIQDVKILNKPGGPLFINYKVRSGETLSKIAYSFYGDPAKWDKLYEANKTVLSSKNFIKKGSIIKIPVENDTANE